MTGAPGAGLRLCYYTNVYPAPSHTTMRREIRALEAQGAQVVRVAARRFAGPLVDADDQREQALTTYTAASLARAVRALLGMALTRPLHLARALIDALRVGRTSRRGVWIHLMYLGEACVLWQATRGCDHVHANFGNATSIAVLCRRLGGPPVSLRIHGPEEFESQSPAEWAWKLAHAGFLAPISEYGVAEVRRRAGPGEQDRVRLLRCGIDAAFIDPAPAPLPRAWHLVCVARLEARKGHEVLFQAIERLLDAGRPVSLTLVGDGPLRAALEQRVRDSALAGRVCFAGWRDGRGVRQAMAAARVVVLPSHAEGLPIVLMEAYAAGRACVATRVAGIPELVVDGVSGWLVSPGDALGLARALDEALGASDAQLQRRAEHGRDAVRRLHLAESLMRELLLHVRSMTGRYQPAVVPPQGASDNSSQRQPSPR